VRNAIAVSDDFHIFFQTLDPYFPRDLGKTFPEFSLEPDKYTVIAETSISIGTATVNLSRDRSVTVSLAKKPVRHDFLEDDRETVIEPVQSFVSAHLIFFTIASFLSMGLAVIFIGFGFSEDEIALKVAGVLVGVLGVATLIFILSGGAA